MKRALLGMGFALAASCGGSDNSGGAKNLNNFQGGAWNGSISTTVNCPGSAPQTTPSSFAVAFSPGNGADLQYTSQAGCTFKFNVSGNTASLSNAPVSCSAASGGTTLTLSWSSYNVTTSDGHALNLTSAGNASDGAQTCSFTITGSATR